MGKKNSRPYSNSRNNNRNMTRVKKNADIKKRLSRDNNKSLESTTRIRVDLDRLNDVDSLDTSFLEGRYSSTKNSSRKKNKKHNKNSNSHNIFLVLKKVCYVLATFTLLIITALFLMDNSKFMTKPSNNKKTTVEKVVKEEKIIDDNYLFLGSFYTDEYDFSDYDYHYVKNASEDYEISDILNDMKKNIYDYNPSKVFIELGINDLRAGKNIEEVLDSLEELVEGIKKNRIYADVYVESLYPINPKVEEYDSDFFTSSIDAKDIKKYNSKIKSLTSRLKVKYIDIYSELSKDDLLNKKYTEDGIHLNEEGYKNIDKIIENIIGDNNEKGKD